ncbi:hypothetical protein ECFDA504_4688, partial [Escherichia coli FDA504]
AYSHR